MKVLFMVDFLSYIRRSGKTEFQTRSRLDFKASTDGVVNMSGGDIYIGLLFSPQTSVVRS